MQWWERTTPSGLPRFYLFAQPDPAEKGGALSRRARICVVELKPDAKNLPFSPRSSRVKRVLLKTVPLPCHTLNGYWVSTGGRTRAMRVWERAERVIIMLNQMPLSVMALEEERGGLQKLFDKLWLEDVERYEVYPKFTDLASLRRDKPKRRPKK